MKASNEVAVYMISECLEENLFEPNKNWPETEFHDRSYARRAAMELAERLMDRPYEDADTIVEEFMLRMEVFANLTEDPVKQRIFSVARDTAEDILTLF